MMIKFFYLIGIAFLLLLITNCDNKKELQVNAPLFIDPNYHGSCDPEVVWNENDNHWYIYYTSRKGTKENTWLGTPLGVIRSNDLINWEFVGYCKFDGKGGIKDEDETFWAPAIIANTNKLHMFVTYKPDTIPEKGPWGGPGKIVHYQTTLENPVDGWKKVADMHDTTLNTIDATVFKVDNKYHLWFKGKKKGKRKNRLYHYVCQDLYDWKETTFIPSDVFNESATGSGFEEAPYAFKWKGKMWLITDPHKGLFVYSSQNGENWKFQGTILEEGGTRKLDNSMARHCSVAKFGDRAFIFYHVEPWRDYSSQIFKQTTSNRRSVLQMAELEIIDGKLTCNRDKTITIETK